MSFCHSHSGVQIVLSIRSSFCQGCTSITVVLLLGRPFVTVFLLSQLSFCHGHPIIAELWDHGIQNSFILPPSHPIQNTVVQSIELQGNSGSTGKSSQNSRGTGIAKLGGAAPLMEAPL